jgi:Zn-dependent peptidase ImmA (M78 family)
MYFKEFLFESKKSSISHFLSFIKKELNLSNLPKIIIIDDPKFSIDNKTFGIFDIDDNCIRIQVSKRHKLDIFRTLAHEIIHYNQRKSGKEINGNDGSVDEDEANSRTAVILRKYSRIIDNHGY